MKYTRLTVGGTFDCFHKGHKVLLDKAFEIGEQVYLGITNDKFVSNSKIKIQIKNYQERKQEVVNYLKLQKLLNRVEIISINDRFGTTLTDENLQAIVVSPETELVATEINLLRAQVNFPALEVVVVPWVLAEDKKPIHTSRILAGEIDRKGRLYTLSKDWGVRKLPETLREKLHQPMGRFFNCHPEFISGSIKKMLKPIQQVQHNKVFLITVGDVVTKTFLDVGITPDLSIIDLIVQRKPVFKNYQDLGFRGDFILKKIENPSGTLSWEGLISLIRLIRRIRRIGKPAILQIVGEEDLLAIFAVFVAPLGSLIVYGQPPRLGVVSHGIVVIEVTEEIKEKMRDILCHFERNEVESRNLIS